MQTKAAATLTRGTRATPETRVVFDGDQRPSNPPPRSDQLPIELSLEEARTFLARATSNIPITFSKDSMPDGSGGNVEQEIDAIRRVLRFAESNVHYFPSTPEELVWSPDIARKIADSVSQHWSSPDVDDPKVQIHSVAETLRLDHNQTFKLFLLAWAEQPDPRVEQMDLLAQSLLGRQ